MGGKKANKQWKKSIKHQNKPLSRLLDEGTLQELPNHPPSLESHLPPSSSQFPSTNDHSEECTLDVLEKKIMTTIESTIRTTMDRYSQVVPGRENYFPLFKG